MARFDEVQDDLDRFVREPAQVGVPDGVRPADGGHRREVVEGRVRHRTGRVGERGAAGERPQRGQRLLPGGGVADVARQDQVHGRAVRLGRDEGKRRRLPDERDRCQLVGSCRGRASA